MQQSRLGGLVRGGGWVGPVTRFVRVIMAGSEPTRATGGQTGGPRRGSWHGAEALAAWVLPGLGHYLLGERKRGLILAVSIGSLWVGGLLIGGISVCDKVDRKAWFIGQALMGPSWAADWYHQRLKHQAIVKGAAQYEPSYGRLSEQGILYTALAGLLNLLAVIDVVYREPRGGGEPEAGAEAPVGEASV